MIEFELDFIFGVSKLFFLAAKIFIQKSVFSIEYVLFGNSFYFFSFSGKTIAIGKVLKVIE